MRKVHVCSSRDIPSNGMKTFDLKNGIKVLVANAGTQYYAYQGICPHQEVCLDEGFYDGSVLTCHQHLWQWDITTGAAVGLAEAPLEAYEVAVEDDQVFVIQASALQTATLFGSISASTMERLNQIARQEHHRAGSTLYGIGDTTDDVYILESGKVDFLIGRDDHTSAAGFVLHKGEVFGWAALLDRHPRRIAKAECLEDSVLIRINGAQVLDILAQDPTSGYLVMRQLANMITRHLTIPKAK
ncbi:cyclic nucleotide-binding domain-containing protein [Glaciimonas immobilis]|uniref:Toluene monooxygenase system ferredoxin subunit n=1 Tax=Glaciimonas immobilis TaxID=728004 RepID=A0A840RXD7_9BURK|nr:cyclic nucleotide-binding domain-containing protein [Glaciimonas immobilis]KAF3996518.1 cyclic nucleotide-binding domain-containing protein [Glaciimonas immobilis]MBB5201120.1 toluene monooxygenase system ferredoxin subunit [Glaciimonas immobilis]